jgi:hypothetical protein
MAHLVSNALIYCTQNIQSKIEIAVVRVNMRYHAMHYAFSV